MIAEADQIILNNKFDELLASLQGVLSDDDQSMLEDAYRLALTVYGNEKHHSGQLLAAHSLDLAILAVEEMGLGFNSALVSLLHDILAIDDTIKQEIQSKFGSVALNMLESYTRISNLPTGKVSVQSDAFRKLFLAVVDDIRVILLKIAHRLGDMRNISSLPKEYQDRYIQEVKYLYSPVAHRLGLYRIKKELEDLSMKFTKPAEYNQIVQKLKDTEPKRKAFIEEFINPIERELYRHGLEFQTRGRPKSIPSIWEKMQKKDVEFEEVFDLFAIRIILNSPEENEKADCWRAYSLVTNIYSPNPKRLRDWISTPKASGYESLHTTVKGPHNKWVEVQIRTERMDEIAEKGQAAHWKYKGFGSKEDSKKWLVQVRDIIEHPEQISFQDTVTPLKESHAGHVFVFTPDGDLKELSHGATVLDFAFEVHTNVGYSCSGAKINNKIVPIKQTLENGDKVEIITSKVQKPKMDWLNYVITSKAKNKIKRALKEEKFLEASKGNEILRRKFRNWKLAFNDENIDKLIKKYKLSSSIDLYSLIYQEKINLLELKRYLTEGSKKTDQGRPGALKETKVIPSAKSDKQEINDIFLIDTNLKEVNYYLARCCNPRPGDAVFGFVTINRGITIHTERCPNARQLLKRFGYRKIDVQWREDPDNSGKK
jgi:GTP pyrophosphokinase